MRSRTFRAICAGAALLLAAVFAHAAFPKSTSSATVRTDRITGNWDSFSFKWIDLNDQQIYLTLTNASGFVSLVGYYPRARISRAGTTYVDVNTSDITITATGVSFTVPYTNIPPPKDYDMELWAWDSATSNQRVTLAQGKVGVSKSLYSDTNQFPFPTSGTLTDYLPRNGSTAMTGNGNAGGYSWTNLAGITLVDGSSVTTAPVSASGLAAVSNAFRTADGALSNSLVALINTGDATVSNAQDAARATLSNYVVATYATLSGMTAVSNAFRSADGALSNSLVGVIDAVASGVSNAFRSADGAMSNSLVSLMDTKDSGVSNAFRSADGALSNSLIGVLDGVASGVSNAFRSADGALSNSLVGVLDGVASGVSNAFRSADGALSNSLIGVMDSVAAGVSNAFRSADGALSNSLIALMDSKDSGVSNAFRSADGALSNSLIGVIDGVASGVSNAFRSADGALSNSIVANFATLSGMTAVSNVAALWPVASNNVPYLNSSSNLWTGANNRFSQRLWADSIRSGIPDVILYGSVLNLSNLTWQSEAEAGNIINLDTMTLSGGEWSTDGTELSGTYIISFLGLTNWWCTMGPRDYANITNTPWTTVETTSNWVARLGPTNVAYFNTNYVTPGVMATQIGNASNSLVGLINAGDATVSNAQDAARVTLSNNIAATYATLAGVSAVSNALNTGYWDFCGIATTATYRATFGSYDESCTPLSWTFACDAGTGQVTILQKAGSDTWFAGGSTMAVLPLATTFATNAVWYQTVLTNGSRWQPRYDGGTCTNFNLVGKYRR